MRAEHDPADARMRPALALDSQHRDDADRLRAAVSGDGGGAVRSGLARLDSVVPPTGVAHPDAGTVSGGGQHTSRSGRTHGSDIGPAGRSVRAFGPGFDAPVTPGGYAWWYVDGLSDDGQHALTLIGFIGSVFSPYYARARRRGRADPYDHCALNVALYGRAGKHWALTERGHAHSSRSSDALVLGRSVLRWTGATLIVDIDEVGVPIPRRVRGTVRVHPQSMPQREFTLDEQRMHRWRPIAPRARIEVALERPYLRWSGSGYLDSNRGEVPLEHSFSSWTWSRAALRGDESAVLYDVHRHDAAPFALALRFAANGQVDAFEPPAPVELPRTLWRIDRSARSEHSAVQVLSTLEDTPFYARSLVRVGLLGQPVVTMHESLSLTRFQTPWVQHLLHYRMPRRR